jgi:hypothetical protein
LRQLKKKLSELKSVSGTHKKNKTKQKKTNIRLPSTVFRTGVLHIHVPSTGFPTKLQITGGKKHPLKVWRNSDTGERQSKIKTARTKKLRAD